MACLRCPVCLLNYPVGTPKCPVSGCGEALDKIAGENLDADWAEEVERRNKALEEAERPGGVVEWRREEFERLGFGAVQAGILADLRTPVHDVEVAVRGGCPLDLAFELFS